MKEFPIPSAAEPFHFYAAPAPAPGKNIGYSSVERKLTLLLVKVFFF
jgi:hypothetical protein